MVFTGVNISHRRTSTSGRIRLAETLFYICSGTNEAIADPTGWAMAVAGQVSLASILHSQGNSGVSLILTTGKGYRADMGGARMPHSWSIVDEAELAQWIAARLDQGNVSQRP